MTSNSETRRSRATRLSILLCSSVAFVSSWSAASAQTSDQPAKVQNNQLEEIVVTAEKRTENVQTVPLSILAIPGTALQTAGVTDALDLPKLAPVLQVSTSSYASDVTFRIRGFGTPGNGASNSDVAVYVDGAFIARPGASVSSMLDIKNIEVLSGPQGTLFGRNAAMGAISINSNTPTYHKSLDVTAEGGSYGTYKLTGVVNIPVSDQFTLRVAALGSHTDGIYHNLLDGKTYGENTTYIGRVSAKWDLAPNVSWLLRFDGSRTRGDGVVGEAVDTSTASATQLANMSTFITGKGGTAPVYSSRPSYTFNQYIGSPYLHDSQFGANSNLSWDVSPKLTLRLIDTYREWSNDQTAGDAVATSLNLVDVRSTTHSVTQSHELQFVSARDAFLGGKLGFTSGLYYFNEDYKLGASFNLGSQFCGAVYGPPAPAFLRALCQAGPQTNAGGTILNQQATSVAGYLQINYSILPKVDLDLGARETYDKKTADFSQYANNKYGVAPFITAEPTKALKFTDTKPSFRASLSWHMTDDVMAFGTFSTGYKSGGFNAAFSPAPTTNADRTYKSETVKDYELGVKAQLLGRRLIVNATLFNTNLKNFQDRSWTGFAFLTRNAGSVRSRGVDLDGRFRAASTVTFNYGLTYLDSIYTDDKDAPQLEGCFTPSPNTLPTGTGQDSTGVHCSLVQDLSGHPLQYAPKYHGHIGLQWDIGAFKGYRTSLYASESYTSSFLTSNTDNPQSRLPGYATTDLSLSIHSPDNKWEFGIFGTNIFDKHYYQATIAQPLAPQMGATTPATAGLGTVYRAYLGDPARFGARLSIHM